jgi:hypothetical protein
MLSSSLLLVKDDTAGSSKSMSFLFLTTLGFFFRLEQIKQFICMRACACVETKILETFGCLLYLCMSLNAARNSRMNGYEYIIIIIIIIIIMFYWLQIMPYCVGNCSPTRTTSKF